MDNNLSLCPVVAIFIFQILLVAKNIRTDLLG
jgi:hypothetical protein